MQIIYGTPIPLTKQKYNWNLEASLKLGYMPLIPVLGKQSWLELYSKTLSQK